MKITPRWTFIFGQCVLLMLLPSCTGNILRTRTQYALNRERDAGVFDEVAFRREVGEQKYAILSSHLAHAELELLVYGIGQSNAIALVNQIADITKITQIMNSPDAVVADKLVRLINAVDSHIRDGRKYGSSTDTLGKIYKLINAVVDTSAVKKLINAVDSQYPHGSPGPDGFTGIERLALIVAMTNEDGDVLVTLLNDICNPLPSRSFDPVGYGKIEYLITQVNTEARLAELISGITDGAGLGNALELIRTTELSSGVVNLTALLNNTGVDHNHLIQIVNSLSQTGAPDNNDSFSDPNGWIPTIKHRWGSLATAPGSWNYYNFYAYGGQANYPANTIPANGHIAFHTRFFTQTSGVVKINYKGNSCGDGLHASVRGCATSDTVSNVTLGAFTIPVNAGICHVIFTCTRNNHETLQLSNFQAPGTQGATLLPAEKVGVLLNQVSIAGVATLGDVLISSGAPDALSAGDVGKLIELIERSHFPESGIGTARLAQVMNAVPEAQKLRRIIKNADAVGIVRLADLLSLVADTAKLTELINQLATLNADKVATLLNNLSQNGNWALLDLIDNTSILHMAQLAAFVNELSNTAAVAQILNGLSPVHYYRRPGFGSLTWSYTRSGGRKLAELIGHIASSGTINTATLAHMINRLSPYGSAPDTIALLVNQLEISLAVSPSGVERLYYIINAMRTEASPQYDSAYDYHDTVHGSDIYGGNYASPSDHLGRLATFVGVLNAAKAQSVAYLVNFTDNNFLWKIPYLLKNVTRVKYLSETINLLNNTELITVMLPTVDADKLLDILRDVGGSTQKGPVHLGGSKIIGNMEIVGDVINQLGTYTDGSLRPVAEQLKLVTIVNNVVHCGVKPEYDVLGSGDTPVFYSELSGSCPEGEDNSRKRVANFLLGLPNGRAAANLVGNVTQTEKIVTLLNGARNVQSLTQIVNLLPPEVLSRLINWTHYDGWYYHNAIHRSMLYLVNRLHPTDIARLVHYGTRIGKGRRMKKCVHWCAGVPYDAGWVETWESCPGAPATCSLEVKYYQYQNDRSSDGQCTAYRGVGPGRIASLLNGETGERLKNLLDKFGVRTSVAALGCGAAVNNQALAGGYGFLSFSSYESIWIDRSAGSYLHEYFVPDPKICKTNYGKDDGPGGYYRSQYGSVGIISYNDGWAHGVFNWDSHQRGYYPEVLLSPWNLPFWNNNPHSVLPLPAAFIASDATGRVIDQIMFDNLAAMWNVINCDLPLIGGITCAVIPSPPMDWRHYAANSSSPEYWKYDLPKDCDVNPVYNAVDGSTNAVGDAYYPIHGY